MLTVACVLKSGGLYDSTWVARLKAMVELHLPIPHRFVCLSDVDVPCERIPLEHNWPGWWSKIELFKLKLEAPILYFDLDTAIVGDLSEIAEHAGNTSLTMLRDFYASEYFGSGVMAWYWRSAFFLYKRFSADPALEMDKRRARMGDQAFIWDNCDGDKVKRWQDVLPGQIVSYKVHCRSGIPANARVVCLHGQPKFRDMPFGDPVRAAWELAA